MYYLWEVHYQQKTLKIEKCHIIFLDDDVEINGTPNWIYINKVPPSVVCSSASGERNEEEIADGVVQDLKMLMDLAAAGKNESGARKSAFADGAKMNFTKLFPKEENIFHYLSFKLFLTLQEYEKNFKEFPNYTRDVEICHPPEDPLKI
ncbi:hypothetical protein AGDE_04079 [Angomonas deanei]|nr:hypothetical protein AGDE_04079 [Angomonas deanei]|eukprot:EPY39849.1 hypothetical protein AGDE_04079 [Angomonas deanei]